MTNPEVMHHDKCCSLSDLIALFNRRGQEISWVWGYFSGLWLGGVGWRIMGVAEAAGQRFIWNGISCPKNQ